MPRKTLGTPTWKTLWILGRKTHAVGDVANLFQDLVWPIEALHELPLGCGWKRRRWPVQELDPDPIMDGKLQPSVLGAVMLLGVLLGLEQSFPDGEQERIALLKKLTRASPAS